MRLKQVEVAGQDALLKAERAHEEERSHLRTELQNAKDQAARSEARIADLEKQTAMESTDAMKRAAQTIQDFEARIQSLVRLPYKFR